jgi:hypothetical protein
LLSVVVGSALPVAVVLHLVEVLLILLTLMFLSKFGALLVDMVALFTVGTATSTNHRASDLAIGLELVRSLLIGLTCLDTGGAAGLGPDFGVTGGRHGLSEAERLSKLLVLFDTLVN